MLECISFNCIYLLIYNFSFLKHTQMELVIGVDMCVFISLHIYSKL